MTLRRRVRTVQTFLEQRSDALDFSALPDPRDPRGQRWSHGALLSTAVLSLMLIAKSLRAAEHISQDLADSQKKRGIHRRVPDSTLGDLLAIEEPEPIRQHIHRHILEEHRRKALEPTVLPIRTISIDGKMVASVDAEVNPDCQKQNPKDQPPYWLYRVVRATLISSAAAVCIDQKAIPADTNDMGVFSAFFRQLERSHRKSGLFELAFVDAGFTSEANARQVDDAQKAYVMNLKGNQPALHQEAQRVLLPLAKSSAPEAETGWESDSSRGWIKRQLFRTREMEKWADWSHLRQTWLVRVLCRQSKDGPVSILEDRFYLTNLPWGRLLPGTILALVRAHWRIENCCFGSLDIQWQEDHGRWVRRGNGLPVTSLLRVLAYNLLALLRASHLRSDQAHAAPWQQLRDWVRDALVWPSLPHDATNPQEVTPTGT